MINHARGAYGEMWHMEMSAMNQRYGDDHATLGAWVVEAPWANPMWKKYFINLVHLRPMDGKPTLFHLEGATHELVVFAVHPDWELDLTEMPNTLQPVNFSAQIICKSDEEAFQRVEAAVLDIITGKLNPDTDGMSQWVERFGDNMVRGWGEEEAVHQARCPSCKSPPPKGPYWQCDSCHAIFDTFKVDAKCPSCGKVFPTTQCHHCHERFPISEWKK